MTDDPHLHAVILAGGKGTRFWPLSRERRPKQLLPITGERSMIAETRARLEGWIPPGRTWVVTGADYAEEIRRELPEVPAERFLVEPVGRNTAPAIGLAAHRIAAEDPAATMVVLPADHHVGEPDAFREVLARAVTLARERPLLVTIGIEPTAPETGYGYIERGQSLDASAFTVARFTEKPDRDRAEAFLATGRFYWNAGIFVWGVSTIVDALARHLPDTDRALREIALAGPESSRGRKLYEALEGTSIDYGVLEKSGDVAVVPGRFGWDDIGSWTALARLGATDAEGNATKGRIVTIDARRNVVVGGGRVVALVGVDDLVVVETDDAILVARVDRAQDVRQVTDELRKRGWKDEL